MPSPSAFPADSREPRIAPLDAPYPEEIERMLAKWMGPIRDRDPLRLFRTLSIHGELASRMGVLGTDSLWSKLIEHWSNEELIELVVTAGWYRVISALVNTIRPELEPWAARFPVRPASQSE